VAGCDALLRLLVHRCFRDQFWTQLYCSELDTLTCKASCRCKIRLQLNRCSRQHQASDFLGNSELLSCGFPVPDRLISPADSSRGPSYAAKYLRGKTVDTVCCWYATCSIAGAQALGECVRRFLWVLSYATTWLLRAAQSGAMCGNNMWSVNGYCRRTAMKQYCASVCSCITDNPTTCRRDSAFLPSWQVKTAHACVATVLKAHTC
jgi:hypothetical protein